MAASIEDSFSTYVNMLLRNSEGDDNISEVWNDYLSDYPFVYAVEQAEEPPSESRTTYFEELNKKWNDFVSVYNGEYFGDSLLDDVPFYFYYIALSPELSEQSIYSIFSDLDFNLDDSRSIINTMMENPTESYALYVILNTKHNYYNSVLDLMDEARAKGCLSSENYLQSCNLDEFSTYGNYLKALEEYSNLPSRIDIYENIAVAGVKDLCLEIFGDNADSDNVSQGDEE